MLVRDEFRGKSVVNALIDLPFALPTIVAGLTLLALYGPNEPGRRRTSPTRARRSSLALLFVTLPFVVRTVQPVLLELDREMEEAAASLGAAPFTTFRRIVLPNLLPAILSGAALALRPGGRRVRLGRPDLRATSRSRPEVASVHIFGQIESDNADGRGGGLGRAARRLARPSCSRSAACAAGPRGTTVLRAGISLVARLPRRVLLGCPVGLVFYRTFEHGLGAGLGRGHDAGGAPRAQADAC